MRRNYYIFSDIRLRRKGNTLYLEKNVTDDDGNDKVERRALPVETIEALYCLGELEWNTKLINFLSQNKIPVHYFNHYGFYTGSFYPREPLVSGFLLINQVEHYRSKKKRLALAREFVRGAAQNILRNLSAKSNGFPNPSTTP